MKNEVPINRLLSTHWENLALLNFEASQAALEPYVPRGTELDLYNGRPIASLVGFEFHGSKLCGIASPRRFDFSEINLRTYLRSQKDGTTGVTFIKELCPSRLACLVARFIFNESFEHCTTALMKTDDYGRKSLRYEWGSGDSKSFVQMDAANTFSELTPGTQEAFVGGRSLVFSRQKDGSPRTFEVQHRPWKFSPAAKVSYDVKGEKFYGRELASIFDRPPTSAFMMDGSVVDVLKH